MSPRAIELLRVLDTHRQALQHSVAALGECLGLQMPTAWPQFPEAFGPAGPHDAQWPSYFFVDRTQNTLVGNGGFATAPNEAGEVEIGYEIAPQHQNQGYASAAVRALIAQAWTQPTVQAVVAHTLAEPNASNAVLRKTGFVCVQEMPHSEVGVVWKWRLLRQA